MKRKMINRKIVVGLMSLTLLAFANVCSYARTAAAPTNTLSYSESLCDKIVCTGNKTDGWTCDMFTGDSFTITGNILLSGVDITQFDVNTSFDLSIGGGFSVSYNLGDDPQYATGKTAATFVETYTDDNDKSHVYQTTRLSWTAAQLAVTITGKTSDIDASGLTPIIASNYEGSDSGPINDVTTASADFGDASVVFGAVTVVGKVTTKDKTAKDGSDFSPSSVKIKGSGIGVQ